MSRARKGWVGEDYKEARESSEVGEYVHYLDCGDGLIVLFTYQIYEVVYFILLIILQLAYNIILVSGVHPSD